MHNPILYNLLTYKNSLNFTCSKINIILFFHSGSYKYSNTQKLCRNLIFAKFLSRYIFIYNRHLCTFFFVLFEDFYANHYIELFLKNQMSNKCKIQSEPIVNEVTS